MNEPKLEPLQMSEYSPEQMLQRAQATLGRAREWVP